MTMKRLFLQLALCLVCFQLPAEQKVNVLRYEDYGAVGDGAHDDQAAIIAAHAEANRKGLPVRIEGNRTYYIGPEGRSAVITTSVDFGKARFIIDDTDVKVFSKPVFIIKPTKEAEIIRGAASLSVGDRSIGAELQERSLIEVENSEKKIYIRKGRNANNGTSCREVLLVDRHGRIDKSTPLHFNYGKVTKMTAYPIDPETLYIKGGEFLTKAVRWTPTLPYVSRNISVKRSNVVIEGLVHKVEGETVEGGAPYSGFISISHAANVIIRNCVFTPHLIYRFPKPDGTPFTRGTYDITVNSATDISFIGCSQTIDIDDDRYWGVMGTNFTRNVYLEGCTFSRYDNHMGVHNLTIKNCTLGHMSIQTNGFGNLLVEGCTLHRKMLINLRPDYGSSWKGEMTIRNCTLTVLNPKSSFAYIVNGTNDATHEFGFDCHLPSKITVDGLVIDDSRITNKDYKGPAVFAPYYAKGPLKPVTPPDLVILKNISVTSGKPLRLSDNAPLFEKTAVRTKNCNFVR